MAGGLGHPVKVPTWLHWWNGLSQFRQSMPAAQCTVRDPAAGLTCVRKCQDIHALLAPVGPLRTTACQAVTSCNVFWVVRDMSCKRRQHRLQPKTNKKKGRKKPTSVPTYPVCLPCVLLLPYPPTHPDLTPPSCLLPPVSVSCLLPLVAGVNKKLSTSAMLTYLK
ncbi:hypothetical protein LX32DRAFT_438810 [Colletotrichum zoysiae]|uniref:Uncharacterized protein n=1 Tax=Colletotrichum zoysiae TaxID=1216348 RepID=A0AAD9HEJ9_9PEZI|nr:hypothetical protein LX32DRAFT_438810 [Colletotrichum zoysiae]